MKVEKVVFLGVIFRKYNKAIQHGQYFQWPKIGH